MLKKIVIVFSLLFVPTALYADPAIRPIENPPEVVNFLLTENFLKKMETIQEGLLSLPSEQPAKGTENDNSIDGLVMSVESRPKLADLIRKNGLTPREYVTGYLALSAALAAAAAIEDKDQIFDDTKSVSKENLEFGKDHADRIRNLLGG